MQSDTEGIGASVEAFDIYDLFADLELEKRFSVFYDPGKHAGEEVYSFQGSVREKNDQELEINYTYQSEWYYGHSVCYGVIHLDMEDRRVICYSLCDRYGDCFTPSTDSIFGTFNEGEFKHITWNIWHDEREPDHGYYDQAEWVGKNEEDEEDDEWVDDKDEEDDDISKMALK